MTSTSPKTSGRKRPGKKLNPNIILDLFIVQLQFLYMKRMYLRVPEAFLERLCKNIQNLKLGKAEEITFMALAIAAFGERKKYNRREELCEKALQKIQKMIPELRRLVRTRK